MCVCVVPCLCVCVTVSVNEPAGSIFTQCLLLVLPHFVELEEEGKDKETPDTDDQDTGFHCRARNI